MASNTQESVKYLRLKKKNDFCAQHQTTKKRSMIIYHLFWLCELNHSKLVIHKKPRLELVLLRPFCDYTEILDNQIHKTQFLPHFKLLKLCEEI